VLFEDEFGEEQSLVELGVSIQSIDVGFVEFGTLVLCHVVEI